MAKRNGLRNWPKLQYDIKAEQHWTPPVFKPVEPVVFVKPVENDIHLTDEGWMG